MDGHIIDNQTMDEKSPHLGDAVHAVQSTESSTRSDPEAKTRCSEFAEGDPENPKNWPSVRRWMIVIAASLMTMISIFATTVIIPAAPQVMQSFNSDSQLYRTLLVTIWDLGEGVTPLVAAPLSEKFGRQRVYHIGNVVGLVCIVACALSTNVSMLVAFRFLGGAFLVAPTISPAIIGDVIRTENRGKAMALGMGLRLLAPFMAPIAGAYINEYLGWRWVFWILAMAVGAFEIFSLVVMRETYAVTILKRKKARLTSGTEPSDQSPAHSRVGFSAIAVLRSVSGPARILILSPPILLVSIYTGFVTGTQFVILTNLTEIMEQRYGFQEGPVGLTFIGPSIGYMLAMLLYALTSDRYINHRKAKDGSFKPEDRLIHMVFGASALPLGLLLYGWTLQAHVQYIVPIIGATVIGISMILAILPTENYLIDAYPVHGASAVGCGMVIRPLFDVTFPLLGPTLYRHTSLGWGNSILGAVAAVFLLPLCMLMKYGERLRKKETWHGKLGP